MALPLLGVLWEGEEGAAGKAQGAQEGLGGLAEGGLGLREASRTTTASTLWTLKRGHRTSLGTLPWCVSFDRGGLEGSKGGLEGVQRGSRGSPEGI